MFHFVRNETRMGTIFLSAVMLLSVGGMASTIKTQRLAYYLQHPQEQFCATDIVVRAKVLLRNHTEEGEKHVIRVYDLKILKIYKGGDLLVSNQTNAVNGVQVNSSGQIKLLIKAYADAVKLTKGTEYLLTGKPTNGSILINAGSWVEPWSAVTPAHQAGISGIYAQNCECQISPCFGKPCKPPLKGCDIPASKFREFYKSCKWRHFYCVKNEEGSACSRHETAEYMDCMSQLP